MSAPTTPSIKPHIASKAEREQTDLLDLLQDLEKYSPLIPDSVTDYHLKRYFTFNDRGGLDCKDDALKRLFSLSAQKFISDICQDAMQHAKVACQLISGFYLKSNTLKGILIKTDGVKGSRTGEKNCRGYRPKSCVDYG